jgi:hypothetical protein
MTRTTRLSTQVLAFALIAAFTAARADAVSISMDPAAAEIGVGDSVDIALNVSGLDAPGVSLGTYDIDVAWDPAVVQLSLVSIGDPLLGDQLNLSGFGTFTTITFGTGTVNLFELSLDPPVTLDTLQAGSFTIATLTFQLVDFGESAITPTVVALGDALGDPLQVEAITGAVVSVVPEPSGAVLALAGLLLVRSRIRRAGLRPA